MADQQNPFTMMGMMQMMQPNKYIDPAYKDKSLPIPGFYTGVAGNTPPTDASGQPIQDFVDYNNIAQGQYQKQLTDYNSQSKQAPAAAPGQGTTLNSTPTSGLGGAWPINPNGAGNQSWMSSAQNPANQARMNPGPGAYYGNNGAQGGGNQYDSARIPLTPFASAPTGPSGPQQGQAATGAAPPSPPDLRQAYLNALSNPGPVTTQGATVPQSAPLGQPSVLDAFLSTHQGGPPAPAGGGYSNAGFFDTLNKLRSA